MNFYFKYSDFLILIPIAWILYFIYIYYSNKKWARLFPSTLTFNKNKLLIFKVFLLHLLRILLITFIILILTEPFSKKTQTETKIISNDIVLVIDISGSMLATDFHPNRLTVALDKASKFIEQRKHDRIGVVLYSAESFLLCPLTFNTSYLISQIQTVKPGILHDGTAIGMGIATAINAFENSKAQNKIIILLSDGMNNSGLIAPLKAAEIAKEKNIKIYTVGIGTTGKAFVPRYADGSGELISVDIHLDEKSLKEIARLTGGFYFNSENEITLVDTYNKISSMEKNDYISFQKIEYTEYKYYLYLFCFLLIFIELTLRLWLIKIYP